MIHSLPFLRQVGGGKMGLYRMMNVGTLCQFDVVDLVLWPRADDTESA